MIVSASRRTDIPKFFGEWFINRVKAGYCTYPNPFNRKQIVRVSMLAQDVDLFVFWTKDPKPFLHQLPFLVSNGYNYFFLYTLNAYPYIIEPNVPSLAERLETFHKLSELSNGKVFWRYDPILLTDVTNTDFHVENFRKIASDLRGKTTRVIISLIDEYKKVLQRINALQERGVHYQFIEINNVEVQAMLKEIKNIAIANGMTITSCADKFNLETVGISNGACIDSDYILRTLDVKIKQKKDLAQRKNCLCVESRDIGVYNSCRHGCVYCYANKSTIKEKHYRNSPSLLGWYE